MIDEGNSEIEIVKVRGEEVEYSKELEEEEGRSLSTFSDKEVESKDLASLEKSGATEAGEESCAYVNIVESSVPYPNSSSSSSRHPTGDDASEDEEANHTNGSRLINGKVKDLSIGSHTEEGLITGGEAASEEGEESGETVEAVAENSIPDKHGIKGIPRIPRRRSRSPSLEEGQSVEEFGKIGGSLSPHNSGTIDSNHTSKKRRKRASSGWDAQNNNSHNSPSLAPVQSGSSGNPHNHFSGVSGNGGVTTNSNSNMSMGPGSPPSMGPGAGIGTGSAMSSGAATSGGPRQNSQISRIYVGSLDYSLNEADLKQVFGSFGSIVNIDMPREGNRSKGFCFIEYASQESAEMALATMNRFVLKGRPIRVGRPTNTSNNNSNQHGGGVGGGGGGGGPGNVINPSIAVFNNNHITHPSHQVQSEATLGTGVAAQSQNRIYIGSVPYSFTTEDLRQIFKAFGVIVSCQLIPSVEKPGTHRGYGFIEYSTAEQARLAIDTMNGFEVGGKQLKVNVATALKPQTGGGGGTGGAGGAQPGVPGTTVGQMQMINPIQNIIPSQIPPSIGIPHQMVLPSMMQMPNVAAPPPLPMYQQPPGGYPLSNGPSPYQIPSTGIPAGGSSSNVILLTNMVGPDEIDDELKEEVKIECSKYGKVYDVRIHVSNNITKPSDRVRIFVVFESPSMAQIAVPALNNRWFGGNQVFCSLYSAERYYSSLLDD